MSSGLPSLAALWVLLILLSSMHEVTSWDYVKSMTSLRANLTGAESGYDRKQRPSRTTVVTVQADPKSLVKLNTALQWMEMMLMVTLHWEDLRLVWGSENTSNLLLYRDDIWIPPVFVQNALSASAVGADMPIETTPSGGANWAIPMSTATSCRVSTRFYPFDTQNCHINLMPWARREMITLLPHPSKPISLDIYMKNAEWDLLDAQMTSENLTNGDSVYSIVSITFGFRRKAGYYVCALVAPVVGTAILMGTVFWVPAASGEKMGYSLTVLLAFMVLLTIVSDQLPPIDTDTSLMQLYLTIVLVLGVAATLLTTLVLRIYNMDDSDEPPNWLKRLALRSRWFPPCRACPRRRDSSCNESKENATPMRKISPSSPITPIKFLCEEDHCKLPWKQVAVMLDALFLRAYAIFILLLTTIFGYLLLTA